MNYIIKKTKEKKGLEFILKGKKHVLKDVNFAILNLEKGEEISHFFKEEAGIIIQRGVCDLEVDQRIFRNLGKRKDVFSGRATAVYVPPNRRFKVAAKSGFKAAIALTSSENSKSDVQIIDPKHVMINIRGRNNWKREVHDIIDHRIAGARLVIGETFNPSGNWSSYPPHKHERNIPNVESAHEELYYFKINPEQGFCFMRLYSDKGRDQAIVVEDGDTVLLPDGYHPVVVAPGYQSYYLWILAGKNQNHIMHDDPRHTWIKKK